MVGGKEIETFLKGKGREREEEKCLYWMTKNNDKEVKENKEDEINGRWIGRVFSEARKNYDKGREQRENMLVKTKEKKNGYKEENEAKKKIYKTHK